jgi:putative DNA primase/helicase
MTDAAFEDWVAAARSVRIENEVARRRIELNGNGVERVGPCPKCGGTDRFSINSKKQVWNCRECKKQSDTGDVIGLVRWLDDCDFKTACTTLNSGEPPPKPDGKADSAYHSAAAITRHDYCNESHQLDRVVFRSGHGDDKKIWQKRPDPDHPGRLKNGAAGCRALPYRLPELLEAIANGHHIAVVEGEPKADLLASWNVAATCNAGGAKKWKREHAAYLKDADVVILSDNDPAGFEHADIVARSLVGIAKRIRRVDLPGLPHKGDIVDWAAAGHSREEFDELISKAPDWTATKQSEKHKRGNAELEAKFIERETAAVLLDPTDPMRSARELVAARFVDEQHRRLLHWHRDTFWLFQNGRYRNADDRIRASVWQFLATARLDAKGNPFFKPTSHNVSNVVDALAAVCHLDSSINPPAWLDDSGDHPKAAELLGVGNGLLHLPTATLIPPTPRYFNLACSDVSFDPNAPPPQQWLAFLKQLFGDDNEAITLLQDWFGYTLSPDTAQQKILMIVGPSRSGKGTIARILTALLGGYDSVATPSLGSLQEVFGLEPLIGKILAVISDARLGGRSDQAKIVERLLSLSGEDGVEAARKFKKAWTGRLPIRFTLLTNELPRLADSSNALAKRFLILVLTESFYGKEDPFLTAKLSTELPGILNWALIGYARLRRRGCFKQPNSGHKTVEQLELLSSPISAYVKDKCKVDQGCTIPINVLFQSWCFWCETNGRRDPGTSQTFGRDLNAAFPAIKATNPLREPNGERRRYYEGIRLRTKEDDDDE